MVACAATLLVLVDAGPQRAPVFLPLRRLHSPVEPVTSQQVHDSFRLTGAVWRPGDVVSRLTAIDIDRPTLPLSYDVIHDTAASRAFDISQSGVMTLTSNTSLLRGMTQVNVTVQAATSDPAGDTLMSNTTLTFELVDSINVGGLAWDCVDQQATVTENAPAATSVTRLTAHIDIADIYTGSDSVVMYHIVSGDPQHVFSIDALTVPTLCSVIQMSVICYH